MIFWVFLFFFFSLYGIQPEDAHSQEVSEPSISNLVNMCIRKITRINIELFNKKFPPLPTKFDDLVKENIISELIFPLSKITDITLEEHDTHFNNWPDCLILNNRRLKLQRNTNYVHLQVIPDHIRTKYFDLETKRQITEEMYTQPKKEQNDKDRLWNVTKESDALVLRFKNATIATRTIAIHKQTQVLFWNNQTISVLQKKNNHVFLLFYDLSPLTNLAEKNYQQALSLKKIIEKSKQGYFFDLTDPDYKSIYETMRQEIKDIISTFRTKKEADRSTKDE